MKSIKSYALVGTMISTLLVAAVSAQQQEIFRPSDTNRESRRITFKLPFTSRSQVIDVEIVGGKIIFEGDIILGDEVSLNAPQLMSAGTNDRRWPNGVIPFLVSTTHPKYNEIMAAIESVSRKTNLYFVKRTTEADYVEYVQGAGCSSFFGRKIGRQEVVVGDCSVGNVIHENLHIAGLYHEQNRSDRDNFVTIKWENIKAGKENNFTRYKDSTVEIFNGSDIGDYDYDSIMHYGTRFFSKNDEPTIEPTKDVEIGQRDHLSVGDLRALRIMYPTKAAPADPYRLTPNMLQTKGDPPRRAETYRPGGIFKP